MDLTHPKSAKNLVSILHYFVGSCIPLPSRTSITSQTRAHMDNYTFSVVEGRVIGGENKKNIVIVKKECAQASLVSCQYLCLEARANIGKCKQIEQQCSQRIYN